MIKTETYTDLRTLFIIIPAFNESANLDRLMTSFREITAEFRAKYYLRFIMVDDGSIDNTGILSQKMAKGLDFVLLSHPATMGPGYAFGTAFKYLESHLRTEDWVVTMEGDNTSPLELLKQMFIRTQEGYEVILASPYMYGGRVVITSAMRTFMSHIANVFIEETLGIHGILTMSSFYRLYRGDVLRRLQLCYGPRIVEHKGFESMVELLLKMIYLQVNISEVPMILDTSHRVGKSKMKILPTIYNYLTLWKDKGRWQKLAINEKETKISDGITSNNTNTKKSIC